MRLIAFAGRNLQIVKFHFKKRFVVSVSERLKQFKRLDKIVTHFLGLDFLVVISLRHKKVVGKSLEIIVYRFAELVYFFGSY